MTKDDPEHANNTDTTDRCDRSVWCARIQKSFGVSNQRKTC